jgi:hypothetical protein
MDPITAALDHVEVGTPVIAANLAMYPLLLPEDSAPGYLTLDEALAAGLASVTEVSESGSVPELLVTNGAKQPVLILDGEELVGTKQNRIVNLTILVAAAQTLRIPVSCVEAGRRVRRSREFAAASSSTTGSCTWRPSRHRSAAPGHARCASSNAGDPRLAARFGYDRAP